MASCEWLQLEVKTIRAGRDYVWLVTGGEAHIGAAAMAYWTAEGAIAQVLEAPHHREGALALELAQLACARLQATVSVIAGIHIDHATKEEIGAIVAKVRELAREELDNLVEQQSL